MIRPESLTAQNNNETGFLTHEITVLTSMCVLKDNRIDVEGAKSIAVSLPHLVNLTTLNLRGKQFDDGCS